MAESAGVRILGVDPGSRATGYGIIDRMGDRLEFVTCGVIRGKPKASFFERLHIIHEGIYDVMNEYRPDVAAIENVFVAANPLSALKLGHARGVAVLASLRMGLTPWEYSAKAVKRAVAGYGQAAKPQVQQMVRVLLNLTTSPSQDAADALAVAICAANHYQTQIKT